MASALEVPLTGPSARVGSQPLGLRLGVAGVAAFLGLLFFFASSFDSPVVRGAGLLVGAIAAFRALRLGIRADRSEIVVHNFLRTHRLRWEDLHMIGIGSGGRAAGPPT